MPSLKINLNERVRVRVNSDTLGQKLKAAGFNVSPVNSFVTLPLWELIQQIGGEIGMGFNPPVSPTITVYKEIFR